MGVSLGKGQNVSLTKEAGGTLSSVSVGLGWDTNARDGAEFDLDAVAFVTGDNGKVRSDADFIFYNNLTSTDGSVAHQGDNLTGEGEGDDEVIKLNLDTMANDVSKIVIATTIHEATERGQNFGDVSNAFIRVVNDADGSELARYDLSEDAGGQTAMIFGELYKKDGEFKFKAIGQGYSSGLSGLATEFGISAS